MHGSALQHYHRTSFYRLLVFPAPLRDNKLARIHPLSVNLVYLLMFLNMEEFFFNARVKDVYAKYGPFQIPDLLDAGVLSIVDKGPFKLSTGVIYHGQWTADLTTRTG